MEIKGVIFDMDGLLLDTEPIYIKCMRKAVGEYGLSLTDELIKECTGVSREKIDKALGNHFGPDFPAVQVNNKHNEYTYEHFRSQGVDLKKGAISLLNKLDQLSIPLALATSTIRVVAESLLEKTGLATYFAAAVFGDQVERGKPCPDIFLEAASRLSIEPELCLVFEDSESGIRGAFEAGMRTILIPDILEPAEEIRNLADAAYADLEEAGRDLPRLLGPGTGGIV